MWNINLAIPHKQGKYDYEDLGVICLEGGLLKPLEWIRSSREYDVESSENKSNVFFTRKVKKEWLMIVFHERSTRVMSDETKKNLRILITES